MPRRILTLLTVLLCCGACKFSGTAPQGLQEGDMFVDFPLAGGRSFSEYVGRGTYVLVYGWASWSVPSVEQLSRLGKVAEELPAGRVVPLALALCDTPAAASPLLAGRAPGVPLAVSETPESSHLLGAGHLPILMLFGPDGTLLKRDLRWRDIPKILRYTGGN